MSVYEREPFGDFLQRIIRIRDTDGKDHPVHDALVQARNNDEEAVAAVASSPDDAVRVRKALRTIHQDFPYGAAVPEQSAYLLRAFVGLDPFGDGDRTTGWTYLLDLLDRHGWDLDADDTARGTFTDDLQERLEAHYPHRFQRRNALDRDDVLATATVWFDAHLRPRGDGADQHL